MKMKLKPHKLSLDFLSYYKVAIKIEPNSSLFKKYVFAYKAVTSFI